MELQAWEASCPCSPICSLTKVSEPKHVKQTVKLTEGTMPHRTHILVRRSSHGSHSQMPGLSLFNPRRKLWPWTPVFQADAMSFVWLCAYVYVYVYSPSHHGAIWLSGLQLGLLMGKNNQTALLSEQHWPDNMSMPWQPQQELSLTPKGFHTNTHQRT